MTEQANILLIHSDQHRYDCLGAYGNTEIQTPHVDALARDGVLFRNSFCSYPVCTPSRYSMLSGLYAHQHTGMSNDSTLPVAVPTLPRILSRDGYQTAAVGKMHFAPTYLDIGFQDMCLAEQFGPGRFEDDYHRWLKEEGLCDRVDMRDQVREFRKQAPKEYRDTFGAQRSDLDEEHHSTTWIAERALERLENWTKNGHFMMVGFIKPHHPFDPPSPWDSLYDAKALTLLPGWTEDLILGDDGRRDYHYFDYTKLSAERLRRIMALYYATISQIDYHVGRMIDMLKQRGLYDNTIVVYTSDHGDYMGYHHRVLKGYRMFEPLVRVPLILKYPAYRHAGHIDERLVSNVDLTPTLLSLVGQKRTQDMVGHDLGVEETDPEFVFAESDAEYMIRSRNRKLLIRRDPEDSAFFDLDRDPLETSNRIHDSACQSEIAALRDRLFQWLLFDSRPPKYLDRHAPERRPENIQTTDESLYAYFEKAFQAALPEVGPSCEPDESTLSAEAAES